MSFEPREIREEIPREGLGSLGGCLMDGDSEQQKLERSIRRRSLAISITVQSAILTALLVVSVLAKPQSIALANITPVPPYSRYRDASQNSGAQHNRGGSPTECHICPRTQISPIMRGPSSPGDPTGPPQPPGIGDGFQVGPEGLFPFARDRNGPAPPNTTETQTKRPRVVRMTILDPAMLIHRVEPVYPPLARQIHREGRVELRAIISTDGTIQSLQIVSGDPIFLHSALEAVEQWRYKPTILNGQAVEIDTYITVVYTIEH